MNCYYHPDRSAVAQCVDCGKGLCAECANKSSNKIPICPTCAKRRLKKAIGAEIVYFVVVAVIYFIGYKIGMNSNRHDGSMGWFFVSLWTGLGLLSGKLDNIPLLGFLVSREVGCFLLLFKYMLATVIGVILWIPISLWYLFCLIRNIYYLYTWNKVEK